VLVSAALPSIDCLRDGQDGRIKARSSLAGACQHKPTVDEDRSARDAVTVDAPCPHSRVNIGRTDRRLYPDRHRLLERFENPDRARDMAATEPAGSAGGTEERWAVSWLNLAKLDLPRFAKSDPSRIFGPH
jgi:hypothetical protein